MQRVSRDLLNRMAQDLSAEDRDEMAIPSYLHRNPAMRWMAWRRVEVVARLLGDLHRERGPFSAVMDFGCGAGVLLGEASRVASLVYGVDLVLGPASLLVDRWNLDRVRLLTPEGAEAEIPERSLDVVVAAEVLEHIDDLSATFEFFQSRLKPDGSLLVSLPTESFVYRIGRRLAGFEGHYHEHDAASIHGAMTAFGFRLQRLEKIPLGGPLSIYWIGVYAPR